MQSSIISKLLTLLTLISQSNQSLTFSELLKKSGLNKSTIHRLLSIGVEEGLVLYDQQSKSYFLGSMVFELVRNAYRGYDIQAVALNEMRQLHASVGLNVTLGVVRGREVVYLRVLDSSLDFDAYQRPGMSEPIHCSASGKAVIAFQPTYAVDTLLDGYPFDQFTKRTITTEKGFRSALGSVRKRGFATNDREQYDHFVGISAPIFNYLTEPIAVLNIWGVYPRHKLLDLKTMSPELKAAAARVTGFIGGVAPSSIAVISDKS